MWIALDVPDAPAAEALMARFSSHRHFKIGMELFYRVGPDKVAQWAQDGKHIIFLDLKLHDIPHTVGQAVRQISRLGVRMLTIHLAGGAVMCEEAASNAQEMDLVGVTLLTSLEERDLRQLGISHTVPRFVENMAEIARATELSGVVTSGAELAQLKVAWPEARFVVPGIREKSGEVHDQARIITPENALRAGATDLVVGRMLTAADNPEQAYDRLQEILARHQPRH